MENSKIEWTQHTFNPWWGCFKISDGCKNCYAEKLDARFGETHWGKDAPRKFMSDAHWNKPLVWNRKAAAAGERHRVFCASMSDVLEILPDGHPSTDAINEARERLWALMAETQSLDWLILTKRPENFHLIPSQNRSHGNIWLGVTAENQEQADIRIPLLLEQSWASVRFVSYEPALGPVDLEKFVCDTSGEPAESFPHFPAKQNHGLNWIICGGESGPGHRPMDLNWVRMMRAQCWWSEIPFLFKQKIEDGKKVSLPILDGVRHAEFPEVCHG